mgnify:CR=1 FL=1
MHLSNVSMPVGLYLMNEAGGFGRAERTPFLILLGPTKCELFPIWHVSVDFFAVSHGLSNDCQKALTLDCLTASQLESTTWVLDNFHILFVCLA